MRLGKSEIGHLFCFALGRTDIEGSESNVAANSWPSQAMYAWFKQVRIFTLRYDAFDAKETFFTLKKIKQKQNICALLRPFPFWLLYLCTCHRYFPWSPSRPVIPMMNSYQLILVPKVPHRGSRLPHLRSTSGKYWDKYLLWPKRSWDRVEPKVGKLWNVKKTFLDFRILKPYLDQNFNPESRKKLVMGWDFIIDHRK